MAVKNSLKVLIDGKPITLAGYEDEEYLQNVSNYINRKISGFSGMKSYRRMSQDERSILLALNIADDYFKAKSQINSLEENIEEREHDSYGVKQELVQAQMEAERLKEENESLKQQLEELKNRSANSNNNKYGYRR